MTSQFKLELIKAATSVEARLRIAIDAQSASNLHVPLSHAVLNGGKRLRAFLVIHSAALFDVQKDDAITAAAAIECLHAYSLVHDDLPCMDDDDLRRGQPTLHVKWDEATAVLAGDALQTLCFELLAMLQHIPATNVIALIQAMAQASGALGMINGQAQDIAAEKAQDPLKIDQIMELQSNKTGALIEWSATSGAIMAGQDIKALSKYARAIGLAFQIQDDILDLTGNAALAGKKLQKDAHAGKATFVSLLGLHEAKEEAKKLVDEAIVALKPYDDRAEPLRQVAQFIIEREM